MEMGRSVMYKYTEHNSSHLCKPGGEHSARPACFPPILEPSLGNPSSNLSPMEEAAWLGAPRALFYLTAPPGVSSNTLCLLSRARKGGPPPFRLTPASGSKWGRWIHLLPRAKPLILPTHSQLFLPMQEGRKRKKQNNFHVQTVSIGSYTSSFFHPLYGEARDMTP